MDILVVPCGSGRQLTCECQHHTLPSQRIHKINLKIARILNMSIFVAGCAVRLSVSIYMVQSSHSLVCFSRYICGPIYYSYYTDYMCVHTFDSYKLIMIYILY
jgi:hypothetical protein